MSQRRQRYPVELRYIDLHDVDDLEQRLVGFAATGEVIERQAISWAFRSRQRRMSSSSISTVSRSSITTRSFGSASITLPISSCALKLINALDFLNHCTTAEVTKGVGDHIHGGLGVVSDKNTGRRTEQQFICHHQSLLIQDRLASEEDFRQLRSHCGCSDIRYETLFDEL